MNGGYLVSAAYFDEYSGPIDAVESGTDSTSCHASARGDALVPWLSSTFAASAGGFSVESEHQRQLGLAQHEARLVDEVVVGSAADGYKPSREFVQRDLCLQACQ